MSVLHPLLLASWLAFGAVGAVAPTEEQKAYQIVKSDYQAGHFAKAAPAFEALWQTFKNPKYLHYAGIAWAAAGNDTHAIYCWREVLEISTATAKQLGDAQRFLAEAYKRTRQVSLHISPSESSAPGTRISLLTADTSIAAITRPAQAFVDDTGGYVVYLTHQPWSVVVSGTTTHVQARAEIDTQATQVILERQPKPGQVHLHVELPPGIQTVEAEVADTQNEWPANRQKLHSGGPQELELAPGTYVLRIDQAGVVPYNRQLVVHPGQTTAIDLRIEAIARATDGPPPLLPPEPPRKLALGLGIASAITTAGGGALLAVGEAPPTNRNPRARAQFITFGGIAAGAGVGLATEALLTRYTKNRPRRVFSSLGIGLAALVGGTAWFASRYGSNLSDLRRRVNPPSIHLYGPSLLFGLGVGFAGGAIAELRHKQRTRRMRADLTFLPNTLRIRF